EDHLVGNCSSVAKDIADRGGPAAEAALAGRVGKNEMQGRGEAGADGLEPLFEGPVVGLVQFADARRIAAASEVLEQKRVVEAVEIAAGQPKRSTQVRSDPAGAHAMPGRLALRD